MGKIDRFGSVAATLFSLISTVSALPLAFGFELAGSSRYVWRGVRLSAGPVFQPSGWISFANLTFAPWFNFNLGTGGDRSGLTEVDLSVDYQGEWAGWTVAPVVTGQFYIGDETGGRDCEAGVEISREVAGVVFTTGHYFQLTARPLAYYALAGVSYERGFFRPVTPGLSVNIGVGSPGFNQVNYGRGFWAVQVIQGEFGVRWCPAGVLEIKPFFNLNLVPDRAVRQAEGGGACMPVFGVSLGRGF